jgi:hypothetical protein
MQKHCPENERIKREYRKFLKHAHGRSDASLDMVAKAIDRFEQYTCHRNFKEFRRQQAIAFGEHLAELKAERSGNALSRGTRHSTLAALRSFFRWLAREPGYKSRIAYHDADYFGLSERDGRIARICFGPKPANQSAGNFLDRGTFVSNATSTTPSSGRIFPVCWRCNANASLAPTVKKAS